MQTFPDDYEFCGNKESVRKQIGMAVPCKGVQIIFEALLKCFAGVEYECDVPSFEPLIHPKQICIYNIEKSDQLKLLESSG